jgi:signal transduction histidine kinase
MTDDNKADRTKKLRDNTDLSLAHERSTKDNYLVNERDSLASPPQQSTAVDRGAVDQSQQSLHADERARREERLRKRLIVEALLEAERLETDTHLIKERHRMDLEVNLTNRLLSDEKSFHDLTKATLVLRDQFLAVVSHDLKNPLGSISMSADVLRDNLRARGGDFASAFEILDVIERNTAIMDRMINDLLDVERMAQSMLKLDIKACNLIDTLNTCSELFKLALERKSFSLTIGANQEPLVANVDADRILQVLSNLVGNALKFSPEGGMIHLGIKKTGDHIEVSVIDNGPGIPEERRVSIFEKFSQLGVADRRGLGLGLFISKWIVEAHQGRLWVEPNVPTGCAFKFSLPCVN